MANQYPPTLRGEDMLREPDHINEAPTAETYSVSLTVKVQVVGTSKDNAIRRATQGIVENSNKSLISIQQVHPSDTQAAISLRERGHNVVDEYGYM